ncbi:MAG TPA: transcriptional regulator [Myxococcota bacterium]|nr:transcriptional regulator [Myxococcota bacterium]
MEIEVRLLGPFAITRGGVALELPASRKVRALFAYLALAPRAQTRGQLCDLLWDVPNDPRGELRWCLSKIRKLVDDPGRRRVDAEDDAIRLDLSDCGVDALDVADAVQEGLESLPVERLRALAAQVEGEFLEGLELDGSPAFAAWLAGQRRRFRGCHTALLEHLVRAAPGDDPFPELEKWLELAPFDRRAHEALLAALVKEGRAGEAEEHLAATARRFEAEGFDPAPLRDAWRAARVRVRADAATPETPPSAARRASVAVLAFSEDGSPGGAADGLTHDVITRLAKLRSLFVIAEGSVFALRDRRVAPEEAARMLDVDYAVSGSLRRLGRRFRVTAELSETRSARVVWAEEFDLAGDEAFAVIDEIGNRIVASVASEIESAERNRAILRPPSSLDAWEAHHRGLWHMYRFNRDDNARARSFFETAIRLDPTFSRAHAALSFTHFQNVFQGWSERAPEIERAYAAAGQSLLADDRDPAAHCAMGRALWLRGSHGHAIAELEASIELSPNFATGHYALAFVHSQSGDAKAAIELSDHSRLLSPFDPLLFAMLGARAMALARLGRAEEAAEWATRASMRPNAHEHIFGIAAYCLALAGRLDEARAQLALIRRTRPGYGIEDFLSAMHFSAEGAALFRGAAGRL